MPHLPALRGKGRRSQQNWRELSNLMFYLARTGCQWRNLPRDFPCWQTVYTTIFKLWYGLGVWQTLNTVLSQFVRQRIDKEVQRTEGKFGVGSIKSPGMVVLLLLTFLSVLRTFALGCFVAKTIMPASCLSYSVNYVTNRSLDLL